MFLFCNSRSFRNITRGSLASKKCAIREAESNLVCDKAEDYSQLLSKILFFYKDVNFSLSFISTNVRS